MSDSDVENRISALEREVEHLKMTVNPTDGTSPWWEQIAGRFTDDRLYEEAMEHGRNFRDADGESESSNTNAQEPS
jgi:hypothetical protein